MNERVLIFSQIITCAPDLQTEEAAADSGDAGTLQPLSFSRGDEGKQHQKSQAYQSRLSRLFLQVGGLHGLFVEEEQSKAPAVSRSP